MKPIKYLIVLLILAMMSGSLISQDRPYRNFGTLELYKKQKKMNKDSVANQAIYSHQVNKFKRQGEYEPIQLECIIHVVHNGSQGYVSEEQIWSQIDALNRDFGLPTLTAADVDEQGKHFIDRAVDTELSFCIAATNQGEPRIEYVETDVLTFSDDDGIKEKSLGGANPDQAQKYINIWIGDLVDTLSGYAQYPGGQNKTDGIVIDYRYFGQIDDPDWPFNEGKTMTHLMGNFLGLLDIWGNRPCGDDLVHDTPLHNGQNIRCPDHRHISSCGSNSLEMPMNFMDNTDDACMYMFTRGQKERMLALLYNGGPRHSLDKNQGECINSAAVPEVVSRSGKEGKKLNYSINIYPNPTDGDLNISLDFMSEDIDLKVTDVSGKLIRTQYIKKSQVGQSLILTTSTWYPGIYFFHFYGENTDDTKKIIIQ